MVIRDRCRLDGMEMGTKTMVEGEPTVEPLIQHEEEAEGLKVG